MLNPTRADFITGKLLLTTASQFLIEGEEGTVRNWLSGLNWCSFSWTLIYTSIAAGITWTSGRSFTSVCKHCLKETCDEYSDSFPSKLATAFPADGGIDDDENYTPAAIQWYGNSLKEFGTKMMSYGHLTVRHVIQTICTIFDADDSLPKLSTSEKEDIIVSLTLPAFANNLETSWWLCKRPRDFRRLVVFCEQDASSCETCRKKDPAKATSIVAFTFTFTFAFAFEARPFALAISALLSFIPFLTFLSAQPPRAHRPSSSTFTNINTTTSSVACIARTTTTAAASRAAATATSSSSLAKSLAPKWSFS